MVRPAPPLLGTPHPAADASCCGRRPPQVVAPYDAEDARGLLKAAIRDPDPVGGVHACGLRARQHVCPSLRQAGWATLVLPGGRPVVRLLVHVPTAGAGSR